jgi:hypothetical protein
MVTAVLLWAKSNGVIQMMYAKRKPLKLSGIDISGLYEELNNSIRRSLNPHSV